MINSFELFIERFNDARNLVRDAIKRSGNWKAFYGVAPITEEYARRDIEIHLHLSCCLNLGLPISEVENKSVKLEWINIPDYCIRIQGYSYLELTSATNTSLKGCASHQSAQYSNEAVFVGIIQFVKKKKGIVPTPIPSLVWLQRINACAKTPMDALKEARTVSVTTTPKMEDEIATPSPSICVTDKMYRECSPAIGGGTIQEGKLPSEPIKCRTKVVGNLANNHTPLIGECRGILNPDVLVSSFSIETGQDNTVGIFFEEPLQRCLQGYNLALCPLDLGSWPIKWMH